MQTIRINTPAKINLTFDILNTREDGYHDIETIFQSISLEDKLLVELEKTSSAQFEICCSNQAIKGLMPLDSSNLMGKAASIFFQFLNLAQKFRVSVQIEKNIPIGAGLAGGSSNAAGMLLGLNELFDRPLNFEQLSLLAAQIGSDVPFCLKGGTCIGRGRGEILSELKSKLQLSLCIVKPRKLSVSTPWAYKSFDNYKGELKKPSIEKALTGLKTADLELALSGFANVFQPLVFQEFPELEKLNQQLIDLGAWASQMSGSGPTLFAVVSGREMGHHLRRQVLRDDDIGFVYGTDEILAEALAPIDFKLAETCDYGVRVLK